MKPGWYPEPLGPWPDGPLGRKVKVLVTESCLTLATPPGSSVHGILQARILEWAAMSFSRDLLNPGNKPRSPTLQADCLPVELLRNLPEHPRISILQFSSVTQSCPTLQPHELQHARRPCPSPTPGVHSNSCPLRQ